MKQLLQRKPLLGVSVLAGAALLLYLFRPEPQVKFNRDIRPILNSRCITCHGGVKKLGGFSVLFREDALSKAKSGKYAIIPGDPDHSELIRRIKLHNPKERMPLKAPPLTDHQIELLTRWVRQGAKWEDHWAYLKPKPQPLPEVSDPRWPTNGIDNFILARLDQEQLQHNPPADCATLIRRASLDLIGLPPTPEEVRAFCADRSPDAYENVVDRLLASPHFGEHWASFWLDLARYADTKGYEKDGGRTIWKYRDWVIDAFNRDLPYDEFTIEQLAGDLLPNATDDQILATAFHRNTTTNDEGGTDDEEFRTAAVIDRVNTTWEVWQGTTMACVQCHSHPYDPFRHEDYYRFFAFFNNTVDHDWSDDNPRLVSYSKAGEQQVQEILGWLEEHGAAPKSSTSKSLWNRVETTLYPRGRIAAAYYQAFEDMYSENEFTIPGRDGAWARYDSLDLTGVEELAVAYSAWGKPGAIEVHLGDPTGEQIAYAQIRERTPEDGNEETVRVPVTPVSGVHDVYFVFRVPPDAGYRIHWFALSNGHPELNPMLHAALLEKHQTLASIPPEVDTPVLRELPEGQRRKTFVFERGNWLVKGDEVQPGVPGSLPPLPKNAPANRLTMARWIVSEDNPLAARVMANRVWAQLFGTGIVETLNDFGTQGELPSHPKLLDWLALQFMNQDGWSVKKLLKQMVVSSTYRQSSHTTPDQLQKDPQNRLLARAPRFRLSAEQIRDQALAASGLLSEKMYGPSVMPPQPPGIWQSPYSSARWIPAEGEDRYRRAVYTYWKRTAPYPSMVAFDSPTREVCVSRRIRTNTPLQALVTLNDPVYVEAAQALARRMVTEGKTVDDRIKAGYRRAMARDPDGPTLARLRSLYNDAQVYYKQNPERRKPAIDPFMPYDTTGAYLKPVDERMPPRSAPVFETVPDDSVDTAALTVVANVILNLDSFLTRE